MSEIGLPREEARGLIGESFEDGFRVVWSFVNELPGDAERTRLPWLIVLAWRYDGGENDGMPDRATQAAIYRLDDSLWSLEDQPSCRRVYSRTGNGLREWVFHAATHEYFMAALNNALADDERYPLDIKFYSDPDWIDFRRLLNDFGQSRPERTN